MGEARGNGGTVLILSWKCNFSIYLDLSILLGYPSNNHTFSFLLVLYVLVPSIYSFFYLTTTLLKSDIFRHSKAYSSHGFQPTGIGLGPLRRGNRCVLPIISVYLQIDKKNHTFQKIPNFLIFFFKKRIIGNTYIRTKCNDNFKFAISLKSYEE